MAIGERVRLKEESESEEWLRPMTVQTFEAKDFQGQALSHSRDTHSIHATAFARISTRRTLFADLFQVTQYRAATMRLTAELINNSLSYLNPLKERELDLRGMPYTQTIS